MKPKSDEAMYKNWLVVHVGFLSLKLIQSYCIQFVLYMSRRASFLTEILNSYGSALRKTYDTMPEIPHNPWSPMTKSRYVSLALITSEEMFSAGLYSRSTVRGSISDVVKHKEPIVFQQVFPEEIGKESRTILIEGRPGCGKTTLMIKVSKDWAKRKILKNVDLLVLVTLRHFVGRKDITLEDILGVYCPSSPMTKELVTKASSTGGKGFAFAFDGLDEYRPATQEGNLVLDIIRGIKLPNAKVFMTSRPAGSHRFRRLVRTNIEIIGFLEEQVEQYIREHYEESPEKAVSLTDFLKSHPNIRRMCYLPLHLAMLVYLYECQAKLPETETEMYKTFVLHTLFRSMKREDPGHAMIEEFDMLPEKKRQIFASICRLAFKATCSQKQIFTGKEIIEGKVLPAPPSGRDFDSLGLLTVDRQIAERALPTRTYSFLHLTLQEFLAAIHLVQLLSDKERLVDKKELLTITDKFGNARQLLMMWKFYFGTTRMESSVSKACFEKMLEANKREAHGRLVLLHCCYESLSTLACTTITKELGGVFDLQTVRLFPLDCAAMMNTAGCGTKQESVISFNLNWCGLDDTCVKTLADCSGSVRDKNVKGVE